MTMRKVHQQQLRGAALILLATALAASLQVPARAAGEPLDLVLAGGRVLDPETGLDAVRHVGIRDGQVVALSEAPLEGRERIDVAGLVVAPGFIDPHVHGHNALSYDFMAQDGVTTALELEVGVIDLPGFVEAREGRARIHHGASAGHIPARVRVKHGFSIRHPTDASWGGRGLLARFVAWLTGWYRPEGWMFEPADEDEIEELVGRLGKVLDTGGLGIGMGLSYTPGASSAEVRAVFSLAASRGVPCFVHIARQENPNDLAPVHEVLDHARESGASLHILHLNSSTLAAAHEAVAAIAEARAGGVDVTTEAHPYTAASTYLESALFEPGWRERRGIDYGDLQWVATGERLTEESFQRYRSEGGTVIIHMMDPENVAFLAGHPDVMVASDGMVMESGGEHPRGAGTHARVLGRYSREQGRLPLMDALRKMTLDPARRLQSMAPAMARKGRVQVGADADLVVFDAEEVIDRATYEDSHQPSAGIVHVLVGGTLVLRDGVLVPGAAPGQAIRAGD